MQDENDEDDVDAMEATLVSPSVLDRKDTKKEQGLERDGQRQGREQQRGSRESGEASL